MLVPDIASFVDDLARQPNTANVHNPWDYSRPENELRRKNLHAYLLKLAQLKPSIILIGEAPGYRGTLRSGVPFASEKLILSHSFFADRSAFDVENHLAPAAEASSTIVWRTLDELDVYPLIWATFPYHPHRPGNPASNRAPLPYEVRAGRPFITRLFDLYDIRTVVAVGRIAERTLADLEIQATAVRHPSRGGARQFAAGLRAILAAQAADVTRARASWQVSQ